VENVFILLKRTGKRLAQKVLQSQTPLPPTSILSFVSSLCWNGTFPLCQRQTGKHGCIDSYFIYDFIM